MTNTLSGSEFLLNKSIVTNSFKGAFESDEIRTVGDAIQYIAKQPEYGPQYG